jgi:RNA recognition motif-containing protein
LEYAHGDRKEARKLLLKAMSITSLDWPETVGELLLRMEREEGDSLDMYQRMVHRFNEVVKNRENKRSKEATKDETIANHSRNKPSKKVDSRKRKADQTEEESSTFKKPHLPSSENKKSEHAKKAENQKSQTEQLPHFVKPKDKTEADDLLTVFVSNLDFKVDEDKLRESFSQFGSITDIRLVKNYKGLSKGFGYIQYSSIEAKRRALANDRLKIDGRPAFVNEVGKKKEFQFKDSIEKNKLFVSGLSQNVSEEDLRNVFSKYGTLRDVRIVTYRNGHSKGIAYIEYEDEIGARTGLAADGLLLKEKNIAVAISDPKQKKEGSGSGSSTFQFLGSAVSAPATSRGVTGRQRISLPMVPSILRKQDVKFSNKSSGNGTH